MLTLFKPYHIKCELFILGTPILTRRMTMRRETIRALEVRKNSVMAERRKSQMQTLGANNEYGVVTNVSERNELSKL